MELYFWQVIVSPHMTALLEKMTMLGYKVHYIALQAMSLERQALGWQSPNPRGITVVILESLDHLEKIIANAALDSIHVVAGIRGNGGLDKIQKRLMQRGFRQWVVMETVDDAGLLGLLKRAVYRLLFYRFRLVVQGVLSIGYKTPGWLVSRGISEDQIYPFTYFLPLPKRPLQVSLLPDNERFRFIYVGQFIERKKLPLLMEALSQLNAEDVELYIVGCGPLEDNLRARADVLLTGRYHWIGQLSMDFARIEIGKADCLVLPSRHDGWGAVVSEALMSGTPVICSDACGAAGVVQLSGYGGVFRSGDTSDLQTALQRILLAGKLSLQARTGLADWARCLGAEAGAHYLHRIFEHKEGKAVRPLPPWFDRPPNK